MSTGGRKRLRAAGQCWHTPLIPALRCQRHADLCEFKMSLVYSKFQYSQGYTEEPCLNKQIHTYIHTYIQNNKTNTQKRLKSSHN